MQANTARNERLQRAWGKLVNISTFPPRPSPITSLLNYLDIKGTILPCTFSRHTCAWYNIFQAEWNNDSETHPSASSWGSDGCPSISVSNSLKRSSILFIIKSTFLPSRDEPSDSLSTCFSSSDASSRSSWEERIQEELDTSHHCTHCSS